MGQWWGDKDEMQRWSPMVHPRPHQKAKDTKTPQGAANPNLGAQMSQEQQNTGAAVTQQQGSSTGPCRMGARAGPPPQSASAWPGAQMSLSGEGGTITDQAGGISAPTTPYSPSSRDWPRESQAFTTSVWESCLEMGHTELGAGELLNSGSRRTSSCSLCHAGSNFWV